ncbi:cytoplasmic polyadenylation element-binding protein 1-B-like isoform X2 [Paramacrobiotus metropolitanus]|uniref:cytoplasmic polyadenylation element-binding protein 1-B-like isoform X2 n=1 Tax=Paramacrobiotus metropolitanus TaxID=2943436 RepID=UPI002445C414|nr:cytoplasmic polyadenylation element-binding protein 1-B-like isoform X2 [Paramacrobiotus metropolitanus]
MFSPENWPPNIGVFVGGVPWDITEKDLQSAFACFGAVKFEWPVGFGPKSAGKARDLQSSPLRGPKYGYLYLIFETEKSVLNLLGSCTYEVERQGPCFFYKVSSEKIQKKAVQIIPWQLNNGKWVQPGYVPEVDEDAPQRTVFVGGIHGQITAGSLARIMIQLFGPVGAVELDTDKTRYPIGSGRVVFRDLRSYMTAVLFGAVELRTNRFTKTIQIDPFLHDSVCSVCYQKVGPLFCRDLACCRYFCKECWEWEHSVVELLRGHKPMMRTSRITGSIGAPDKSLSPPQKPLLQSCVKAL